MNPINVGFIGAGRISDLHAMGYKGRKDARIVAVCATTQENAKRKADEWGAEKIFTDYKELLKDPDIDLVEILTPHHMHEEMTIEACRAGKHVSLQKPMSITISEADNMIKAADEAGVILRIYENFVFYEPYRIAKNMVDSGEIGEPQMIRLHVNTGTRETGWEVPQKAWSWRFTEETCGGGPLIFDHGYHLFSLARYMMGEVKRVYAWIDHSKLKGRTDQYIDAPGTIMFQFKGRQKYGVLDFEYTPNMRIDSLYYTDDDRVEVIGDKGTIFINRCTAKTVDLPEVMMFRDGKTTPIPVENVEWHDSFIACTHHLIDVMKNGGEPFLDGRTGKAVMQFSLAAHISAQRGIEVCPDEVT